MKKFGQKLIVFDKLLPITSPTLSSCLLLGKLLNTREKKVEDLWSIFFSASLIGTPLLMAMVLFGSVKLRNVNLLLIRGELFIRSFIFLNMLKVLSSYTPQKFRVQSHITR